MKLLRIKLFSSFRGLQEGFEIKFYNDITEAKSLEPICFVGQNGCGKSNVMEALSEIFYELELMHHNYSDDDNEDYLLNNKESYGYEIEYLLPTEKNIDKVRPYYTFNGYKWIKVKKEKEGSPHFFVMNNNEYHRVSDRNDRKKLLPTKIIGYSSGMNELISSPFIKMRFNYFNEFEMNLANEFKSDIEGSRMFYMDYETNSLILISNYLMHDVSKINVINEILNVRKLHSFRIVIQLAGTEIDETYNINRDETIESVIDKLKKCATCYNDELKTDKKSIILDYYVSQATHKAFKFYFNSASELYGMFYLLNSLNAFTIPSYQRKRIIKSKSASTLSGIIPKTTDDNLIFRIENILLCKNEVPEPIHYRKFSDGEHQLMQTIGAVLLIHEPGTLFLMDEPETHFNPQWRSKFVSTLKKITENEATGRRQELILTTHSPFILSDCQTHNVFKFERKNGIVKAENPNIHTYGTSFNILYKEIFDKESTISDLAAEDIERLKNEAIETSEDIERIKDKVLKLGESAEKFFLLSYLNKKEKQINSKGDDK